MWWWLALAFLLTPLTPPPAPMVSRAAQAAGPIIGPQDALGFDYLTADLTTFTVSRFEVSWDNATCASSGAWSAIGIPTGRTLADTPGGALTYPVVPPFTSGSHLWCVRAVNIAGPGGPAGPLDFAAVGSVPTAIPTNLRKIPRT